MSTNGDWATYVYRRDAEYGFPTAGAEVEFAAESTCSFLEISGCGDGQSRETKEGVLGDEGLENLLSSNGNGRPGGLKLLMGICGDNSPRGGLVLPFKKKSFETIVERFGISDQFLPIMSGTIARAVKYTHAPRANQSKFWLSYIFRLGIWRPNSYQIAISWDSNTETTYALLMSKRPEHEFPFVINTLKDKWKSSPHHLLPVALLMQLVLKSKAEGIQHANKRLNDMEELMGQHEYANRPVGDPLAIDFVGATRALSFLARMLGVKVMTSRSLLLALDMIKKEVDGSENACARVIKEMAEDHANACENLILRAQYLEKRVTTQVSVVYQFMAQKDSKVNISLASTSATIARESKKDSSAMKAIALLTMCFLPGTFLAAIFAMPLFNWDGSGPVVKDGFKYYWAIAIPLTLLVLLAWALFMLFPSPRWVDRLWWRKNRKDVEASAEHDKS